MEATKAGRYPTLSFGAQLGTNYSSTYQRPSGEKIVQVPPRHTGFVHINGNDFMVQSTAFHYAQRQYEVGLINPIAYLSSQNHLFQAKTAVASSRYAYLFKRKVLDFIGQQRFQF